jgi:hypothetical protein
MCSHLSACAVNCCEVTKGVCKHRNRGIDASLTDAGLLGAQFKRCTRQLQVGNTSQESGIERSTHLQEVLLGKQAVLDFEVQALQGPAPHLRQRVHWTMHKEFPKDDCL